MKAVVCTKYGPPEVLQLEEVDTPEPQDDELRIRICATEVTSGDVRMRSFTVPVSYWIPGRIMLGITRPKRAILGQVLAGVVDMVGKDVRRFRPGDRGSGGPGHGFGAYAEYVCLPEEPKDGALARIPDHMSYENAVAISFGALTALYFLRQAKIRQGHEVLIYGASGSVGTYAVQLAKDSGAVVTGVCSTKNVELVQSLGADTVLDYTREDFSQGDKTYDVIFDAVGKASFAACIGALKEQGVLLHAVAAPAIGTRMRWASMTSSKRMVGGTAISNTEDFDYLAGLVEAGRIRPVIDRVYPLAQIVDAHRYVDTGRKTGSVVIAVAHCDA